MKYGIVYVQDLFEAADNGHDPYIETFDFEELKVRLQEELSENGEPDFKSCRSLSEVNYMVATMVPDVVAVEID